MADTRPIEDRPTPDEEYALGLTSSLEVRLPRGEAHSAGVRYWNRDGDEVWPDQFPALLAG